MNDRVNLISSKTVGVLWVFKEQNMIRQWHTAALNPIVVEWLQRTQDLLGYSLIMALMKEMSVMLTEQRGISPKPAVLGQKTHINLRISYCRERERMSYRWHILQLEATGIDPHSINKEINKNVPFCKLITVRPLTPQLRKITLIKMSWSTNPLVHWQLFCLLMVSQAIWRLYFYLVGYLILCNQ